MHYFYHAKINIHIYIRFRQITHKYSIKNKKNNVIMSFFRSNKQINELSKPESLNRIESDKNKSIKKVSSAKTFELPKISQKYAFNMKNIHLNDKQNQKNTIESSTQNIRQSLKYIHRRKLNQTTSCQNLIDQRHVNQLKYPRKSQNTLKSIQCIMSPQYDSSQAQKFLEPQIFSQKLKQLKKQTQKRQLKKTIIVKKQKLLRSNSKMLKVNKYLDHNTSIMTHSKQNVEHFTARNTTKDKILQVTQKNIDFRNDHQIDQLDQKLQRLMNRVKSQKQIQINFKLQNFMFLHH